MVVRETGCYIDSHHGIYAIECLIDLVEGLVDHYDGEVDRKIARLYLRGMDGESITVTLKPGGDPEVLTFQDAADMVLTQGGLYDLLEDLLNENVAMDGYLFGWHEGDFMYWPVSEWLEASC